MGETNTLSTIMYHQKDNGKKKFLRENIPSKSASVYWRQNGNVIVMPRRRIAPKCLLYEQVPRMDSSHFTLQTPSGEIITPLSTNYSL